MSVNNNESNELPVDGTSETVKENGGHGLDLVGEDRTLPSNATAIRLLGRALEELEKGLLWKMGGQVGGLQEVAEMLIHTNAGYINVNVNLNFDADALRRYIDELDKANV